MKTKIRRFSKSVLSVILAMTLIMSTMLIGTISVNATISGLSALYFTPDSSKWADASATFKLEYTTSGGTNTRVPFELIDSENSVYKATLDSSTTYTKFKFWRYSSDGKTDWNSSKEFDTIPTGMNYFTKTSDWWDNWDPTSSNYGTWSTYGSGSGGGTAVTDENLLSVLKGEKVMFYGGELTAWNQQYFYVMNTNSTSDKDASGEMSGKYNLSSKGETEFATFCLPIKDYYMGHWESGLHTTVEAGAAYIVRDKTSGTGFTQKSNSGSNYLYSYNNGATLTATTTCASEISGGSSLNVNTSTLAGTSTIGKTNVIKYYIGDSSNSNYAEYTLTDGKLDTSSLPEGSYTLKTVLYDQDKLYVVADTDDFTVSAPTEPTTTQPAQSKFYIIGHQFPSADGQNIWETSNKNNEMTYDETKKVFSYKKTFTSGDNYFRFHDGSTFYGALSENLAIEDNGAKTTLSTTENGGKYSFQYKGTNNSEVTIYYKPETQEAWIESPSAQTYNITKGIVDAAKGNFTVTVNGASATSAAEGATVTVTPSPVTTTDYSYAVDEVSYTTDGGTKTTVTAADGVYSFAMPAKNVTVNVTFKKKYTITSGTCRGGSVGLGVGGTSTTMTVDAADSGTVINVTAKPDTNYEFVSWVDTDGVRFTDSTSSETTATVTKNATITATFRSTAVAPYYLSYYHKKSETEGENKYVPMTPNKTDGTYTFDFTSTYVNENSGKFKITNSDSTDPVAADQDSMCINRNNPTIQVSNALTADNVTVTNLGSGDYYDIQVSDTTKEYKITFTPDSTNPLTGTIYVDYLSSTPTPNLSLSPTSANLAVGETLKLTATHNGCEGTVSYDSNAEGVATVNASGVVTAVAKGTATITASCTNGEKATCTVTVSAIPYAQANRLYAYAGTLVDSATPDPQAWIAAENNASQQSVYNNDAVPTGASAYPKLGSTSEASLRIFLPTSASSTSVVLYNNYSSSIKLKNSTTNAETTINSGEYATVAYEPGQSFKFTADSVERTLVIYKSSAQGALYLNNTGEYSSFDENGVPKMLKQLYKGKDSGEIPDKTGNAGAYSDKDGNVVNSPVKKIKGRGNSTWNYTDKKSFNVTFADKFKGFGFTKSGKKYSLLANFKDASLSRNKILYQLAELMGAKYVPEVATIDLYMNGLYMGSYLMCQKIEVGPNEVVNDEGVTGTLLDIKTSTEAEKAATIAAANAGFSFLMELDSNAKPGADYLIQVGDQKITLKEPEYLDDSNNKYNDDLTTAIDTFVTKKYTDLNNAIGNTSITYDELNKIIDVKSLANYYLLNELAKNYDIGVTSTYLVYNKTENKFYISPVWDLDVSTGNCDKTNNNYRSYEGNWTNDNSSINYFMKKVFNNPQVQSAARAKWTDSYYTELVKNINALVDGGTLSNEKTVTGAKQDISGSYENNFKKWSYPYGFTAQEDYINARTSLTTASYDVSTHTYSKASSDTSYSEGKTAQDTINYVRDWLLSRAAWMTKKYNTYTIGGLDKWQDFDRTAMENKGDGTHVYTITSNISSQYGIKVFSDYNLNLGLSSPENGTSTCINFDRSLTVVDASENGSIESASGENMNCAFSVTSASAEAPVYLIYNQKTNTLTLSDTQSTSTNPSVILEGSDVDNADIKDGTAVTLTATITPATNNNVVVTGEYTAKLYIGERVVNTEKVNFTNTDKSKVVTFSTYLEGTNQTYKVVVTCNDGEQDRTGTSNPVIYKQTGVKDQKIYFDPSPYITADGAIWKNVTAQDSVVTVTLSDSTTFKMYIDSNDVHGLDKGVFRADIDEETLAKLQSSSTTITFSMDGTDLSCSVAGQSDIADGWIYNYSSQTSDGQMTWEQYNVAYEESYPGGCTTYAEFKDYLAAQSAVGGNTDNIVYFDNSASKFYNVYMYCWDSGTVGSDNVKNGLLMKKLPYADIWYYDFGSVTPSANFLFKDRSGPGFGTDYQQTVDLSGNTKDEDTSNDAYVYNGDGAKVYLNFAGTIDTPNPIFVTQNFYKCTVQNLTEDKKTDGLKFRAFNTQWNEFADVVASDVQTKAVDIYFDLHDKTATDIQLYHSSTKYTFASEFTRLTQMPGSTIYHSTIMLPYTEKDGIVFTFDKFVVNYSGGKKTCTMSANVQPTFTCINTGEVWYEINSDFANVGIDPKVDSASLLTANSPLLNASGEVTPSVVYVPKNLTVGGNTVSGIYLWSDNSLYIEYPYPSTESNLVDFPIVKIQNNEYYAVSYNITDGSSNFYFYLRSPNNQTDKCTGYTVGNSYIITNTEISNKGTATYRTTTETTVYVAGNFAAKNNDVNHFAVFSGRDSLDYDFAFTATEYKYKGYTVYKAVAIDVSTLKTYAHIDASDSADEKRIRNIINDDTVGKYNNHLYYFAGSDSSENGWISNWGETVEPTISFTPNSISLTLDNGTASTTLTPTVTNASGKNVTYSVDKTDGVTLTPSADTLSAEFKATKAGTYVVTATIEDTTATAQVTITVSEPVITDYCGVLAYNHSTATFDVTGGGKIDNTDVVLTNGYYKNTDGDNTVTTGYTSYDGTTYTVIYALPSTASSGATTSYSSTTSHTDSNYKFNDWTKNGIVKSTVRALSDDISGTSTVAYVANWSLVKKVSYTFTYKYYEFNTSLGMAYADGRATILNEGYVIQVTLPEGSSDDVIKAAYLANAPKLESDYYIYSFDGVDISISGLNASATAKNDTIRYYTVRFDNGNTTTVNKYPYQHVAELTYDGDVPEGKYVAWKNENGEILHYGTTYKFRVTRNIDIKYEVVNSDSVSPATYVNEPTYEFFISNKKEYVRFNILVENILADLSFGNVEFGTLYFYTDSTGKPNNSVISQDSEIDPSTLITVSDGTLSVNSGVNKYVASTVSSEYKYIFAPKIQNTTSNVDKYVRVYSYIAVKDDNGKYTNVTVSNSYALASIRDALNRS